MSDLVADYFARLARIDGPVLTDIGGAELRSVSGRNLTDMLDRLGAYMAEQGVATGDKVLALFDNNLESALLLLAAMRHGVTLCLQPAAAGEAELAKAQALVGCRVRINATGRANGGVAALQLDQLPPEGRPAPDLPPLTPLTITFTSGSTGEPKGIVHAAESFLGCAEAFNRQAGITARDRFLNVMPMYYMAGVFNGILAPLQAGAPVIIDAAFGTATAMRFWPLLQANAITAMWLSPAMLSLATRLDRTDKSVPEGFRRLFVGTGAMTKADAEAFMAVYGIPPLQSYGLSELLYISVDDSQAPAFGTAGKPLEGVEVDFDMLGHLTIRSPYAFLGYLTDTGIETASPFFLTSDLAELADGRLSILGRSDDIIVRGGVNINPIELEVLLTRLCGSRGFCITGLPDPTLGQRVVLVLEGAARPADANFFARAQRLLLDKGGRARIDALAHVDMLPLGPTGKIRRSALRAALLRDGGAK
jgi:acyl-coenzyme A synthetase/AMP-(fatty) acid ligase